MTLLAITLAPKEHETLPSLFARIAAANGLYASSFASDLGLPLKKIAALEEATTRRFCELAGLTATQRRELLSWSGVRAGNAQMKFCGEHFGSRSLRNPTVRGCIECLKDDYSKSGVSPLQNLYYRGHWQFKELDTCIKHKCSLQPLWATSNLSERCDFSRNFGALLPRLNHNTPPTKRIEPSPYDHWLDQRLINRSDSTWLTSQSVFSATKFMRHLGAQITSSACPRTAHAAGFRAMSSSHSALLDTLHSMAQKATSAGIKPQGAFGRIYPLLNREFADQPEFDTFRDIMRTVILDHWPINDKQALLGKHMPNTGKTSVKQAALALDVGSKLLDKYLTALGVFPSSDTRPPNRKMFEKSKYLKELTELPSLVGSSSMAKAMGASRTEFRKLAEEGILQPAVPEGIIKTPWRSKDGTAFIDRLNALVTIDSVNGSNWVTLLQAQKLVQASLQELLAAIFEKTLALATRSDKGGFSSFVVRRDDIGALFSGYHQVEIHSDSISAAAFARQIGIREAGVFDRFLNSGLLPDVHTNKNKHGSKSLTLSPADIAAFHQNYVTLSTLSTRARCHRNSANAIIKKHQIQPISTEGFVFHAIYRIEDLFALFPALQDSETSHPSIGSST